MKSIRTILLVTIFAVAFALVEASVVVYLRQIFYPEGFSFPLKSASVSHVGVEVAREFATLVMLIAVGMIAGKSRWQRFAYFLIGFGVWDMFYYVWLKLMLNWPASMLDWDILFLIPIPWIGPVIAPVLVSVVMIAGGWLILRKEEQHGTFRASRAATALALLGSVIILVSFLLDTDATLRFQYPKPYHYELLALGMACYAGALIATARGRREI
jgi:Flp pilus assembly pilin Flp